MHKISLHVELTLTIETDLTSPVDIMDNIDLSAIGNDVVEVYDTETDNFYITDSR